MKKTPTRGPQVSATDQSGATDLTRQDDDVPFETGRGASASAEGRQQAALRIDLTFGGGGAAFGDFMNPFTSAWARAVVAEPDGHVVVVGSVGDENAPEGRNIGLIRFDRNGLRDPQFGTDGYKVLDLEGVDNVARAVALQPDGKIIVAGEILDKNHGTYDFALVRLDAKGQLDSSFGGGVVATDFLRAKNDRAYAVAVQADGKVVAAGHSEYFLPDDTDDVECFALARYNADGSLDTAFGIGGRVMTAVGGGSRFPNRARALQIQADGRLLTAGSQGSSRDPSDSGVTLARYNTDGSPDETFGRHGRVSVAIAGDWHTQAHALAVQNDGKIVIAGATARDAESEPHFFVARLNTDGMPDQTFSGSESAVVDPEWGVFVLTKAVNRKFVGLARAVVVLPDGRIVAAGSAAVTAVAENGERVTREQVALVCYMPDGSADETFGTGGVLFVDLGGSEDSAAGIVLSGDKILVAGTSRTGAKSEFALIRLAENHQH